MAAVASGEVPSSRASVNSSRQACAFSYALSAFSRSPARVYAVCQLAWAGVSWWCVSRSEPCVSCFRLLRSCCLSFPRHHSLLSLIMATASASVLLLPQCRGASGHSLSRFKTAFRNLWSSGAFHTPRDHTLRPSRHRKNQLTDRRIVELAPIVQIVAVQVIHDLPLPALLVGVQPERLVVQLVPRQIRRRVVEPLRSRCVEVAQRALAAAEVVVDAEALLVFLEGAEFAEEGEVFLGVLGSALHSSFLSCRSSSRHNLVHTARRNSYEPA